jgi:hypothetical protein
MEEQLKKLVTDKISELHKHDKTIRVLYEAIESCQDLKTYYHRDIVLDGFKDNEVLVEELINYNNTRFDTLIEDMMEDPLFNLDDNNDLIEVNSWVEIEYKRYVFEYFTYCLKTLSESNETIENNVC